MAGECDPKKRLHSIITTLHKSLECPICLETVQIPFKLCAKGHGICLECMTNLEKCPLCSELFTLDNLVCVRSILEALPRFCHYTDDGCEEVVEPGDDHEVFCGYKPIVCRDEGCSVKMPLNQILDHYNKQHPNTFVITAANITLTWKIELELEIHYYTLVSLFDNIFWILEINDTKEKQFKIYFQATPISKLDRNYYARVTFDDFKDVTYTYTLKASMFRACENKYEGNDDHEEVDLSGEEYCMRIPLSELSKFVNDNGELCYEIIFFEK